MHSLRAPQWQYLLNNRTCSTVIQKLNTSRAEQPLTKQMRLERRPEKTCRKKNPWEKHGRKSG